MGLNMTDEDAQVDEARRKKFPNQITVHHQGAPFRIDVDAEIRIDQTDLMQSFLDQAGKYAWYAAVHAAALAMVDRTKRQRDTTKARAMSRLRRERDPKTGKYPSETQVLNMVDAEEDVEAAQKAYHDALEQEYILKAVKEAFAHRRDMLTQIGADVRQEKREKSF
jgi:hypothetical protein